jgi:hypothetical protein
MSNFAEFMDKLFRSVEMKTIGSKVFSKVLKGLGLNFKNMGKRWLSPGVHMRRRSLTWGIERRDETFEKNPVLAEVRMYNNKVAHRKYPWWPSGHLHNWLPFLSANVSIVVRKRNFRRE